MTKLELFAIKFSIFTAIVSTILVIPFAVIISILLMKTKFKIKVFLEGFFTLPLVLPPTVTGYILLSVFSKNFFIGNFFAKVLKIDIAFNVPAVIISSFIVSFPLALRPIKLTLEGINKNYLKISQSLGKSRIKTFFLITLPLSYKGILAAAILAFARSMGEFGATIMFAGNIPYKTTTIPIAIFSFFNRIDGEKQVFHLVIISILISISALILSEIYIRKVKNYDSN